MIQSAPKTNQGEQQYIALTDLISLKDARIPGGAYAMRPLNAIHVDQLVDSNPEKWPAILVTRWPGVDGYIVIDGYHRWRAAQIKDLQLIRAVEVTYKDTNQIIDAAFRANMTHGLKASISTRGDYAFWLHVTFPTYPQDEIAKRAGLTQGTVSRAIAKREQALHEAEDQQQHEERYIDPKQQRRVARRAVRRFARDAVRFAEQVAYVEDEAELAALLAKTLKPEEQARIARLARLFAAREERQ